MRIEALRMMELLRAFRPRLIASSPGVRLEPDQDIELQLFSEQVSLVTGLLDEAGLQYRPVDDTSPHCSDRHLRVYDRFQFVLTIHEDAQALEQLGRMAADGSLPEPERLSIAQLERLLPREHPCWRRCCTMRARPSIRATTYRPACPPWMALLRRGRPG